MKSITELLNSLSHPTQALGAAQGLRPASSNPGPAKGESFGDVVNRLNAQNPGSQGQGAPASNGSTANPPSQAPASTAGGAQSSEGQTTPGGGAVQATFLDQIDIRFSETIRGKASADQVQQSMAALASAFQQMVGFLLSNPGATADQVQGQIVAATQGTVSPDAAKALVAAVQGFLQSLPPSQKALLSDESTRKNLFNQLFQGLAQAAAGVQPAAMGGSTTETFDFQMAFGTQSVTSAGAGTQGSQFFEAGLSMAGFNDQNLQTSFTNSVLDGGPLTGASLADLSQQENVLLTNLASQPLASSTTATPGQSNGMGRALADLLGRAGAGQVDLASFTQAQPTTSANQLNRVAPVDFNRVFALLTDSLRQASAIPPVTPSDTLQAPSPAMLPAFGTLPPSAPETSILAAPAVVTLQNPTPQTLSTADPTDRILAVRQFFEQLSVSFNSVTAASTPAQSQAVTPPAFAPAGAPNPPVGSGPLEQTPVQANLETVPQQLNSTPASGNEAQAQDVQTFQNFLRSPVVVGSQTDAFSVDVVNAPAPPPAGPNPTSAPTASQSGPATQGVLTTNPAPVPVTVPPSNTPADAPVVALTEANAPQPPVGTRPQETVAAAALFTNTVVVGENVKPAVAQTVAGLVPHNPNQALPTDPNLSAVQSINPVLAQGVNSVSTVAEFAALKDQSFKGQDPLSGIPTAPATTEDSTSLAGAASFLQTVQANNNSNPNANPINAAGVILQFAEQISQHTSQTHSVSRLSFQLVPENLGRVTIQIALVDQSVSARIVVTNPDVKDGLQNHMVDLKAALNQAGLQIDQLQVQVQGGGANLLGQYYQYQQEGASYSAPVGYAVTQEAAEVENTGLLAPLSSREGLVNLLA